MHTLMVLSAWILPILIGTILIYGTYKKVPTYESFVEGGKEGISISFSIIPYLIGMLVAISVFRASGAMDAIVNAVKPLFSLLGIPSEVVPLALIRPISGNAALGMTSDLMATFGPDSLIGRFISAQSESRKWVMQSKSASWQMWLGSLLPLRWSGFYSDIEERL